jgi:hypothetical protein
MEKVIFNYMLASKFWLGVHPISLVQTEAVEASQ